MMKINDETFCSKEVTKNSWVPNVQKQSYIIIKQFLLFTKNHTE